MSVYKKYRLNDNHPTVKAFNELCDKAEELGISLQFLGFRTYIVHNNNQYDLEDLENSGTVSKFPPVFETKMTYER